MSKSPHGTLFNSYDGIEMVWKQRSGTDHNAVNDDDVLVNNTI